MKRTKVLVSAYACNPASLLQLHPGEDIVGWMLVKQISRFHDVWVLTEAYNREAVEEALNKKKLDNVRFEFIRLPFNLRLLYKFAIGERIYYFLWQIWAWQKAKKLHKTIYFDVAHHVTFNNDWIPSFIGAYLPVPFIWGPVGGGQRTPKSFYKAYPLRGKIADRIRLFGQWIGRHLLIPRQRLIQRARAILVCNEETKNNMPEKYTDKIYYFPVNGILTSELHSNLKERELNSPFTLITAGRMIHWKNFRLAVKVFAEFAEEIPESRFYIIGDGPERAELMSLAAQRNVEDRVIFISWLPQRELFGKMRESDVFLYPSLREGGGAVIVEAMACGLPVICLDNAGPGFHVQKEWGIKIEPRDPEYVKCEMLRALIFLSHNEDLCRKLGNAARKRIEDFYVWDRQGERLEEIYKERVLYNTGNSHEH